MRWLFEREFNLLDGFLFWFAVVLFVCTVVLSMTEAHK